MKNPPNVLLICADHWAGRHLRSAGHPSVMTPTIDQLANLGTSFIQATSACPVCMPARRTLMTGLSARGHGDRRFDEVADFPCVPSLAQCFRDAGYQASAVGKLHVNPQRNRIGFDEVILNEEGRHHSEMTSDDWELYLAEQGFAGREYAAGANNNDYLVTPWHLPDEHHQTNWTAREMCRTIYRRDPRKPGFWYLSFAAPHPPMWPLKTYLDLYRDVTLDDPIESEWSADSSALPYKIRSYRSGDSMRGAQPHERDLARRAFYAMITHIDHQIRVVLGTLREEGLLDNTIIALTSDHGDMLGDHGMWGKQVMYESSCRVPFIVVPPPAATAQRGVCDNRLVELRDMMPTLLELAGLPVPPHVEGISALTGERRKSLYGEHGEGILATRMLRDERYKLIYYPDGNRFQLFDLESDPGERADLSASASHTEVLKRLQAGLASQLYGGDEAWINDGAWVGLPANTEPPKPNFKFSGQRGIRFL